MDHILGTVLNLDSRTRFGLSHFGISDIYELLYIEPRVDLQGEFVIGESDTNVGYLHQINNMTIRKIEILQSWFASQSVEDSNEIDW